MPPVAANSQTSTVPLCVDLDGTLIRTDVLWESLILLVKRNPFYLLALPFWLLRGRAYMKQQIAARTELNAADLPYHEPFLEYLKSEHRKGRPLILATAADLRLAKNVADHVGLFSEVIASNGATNMRGRNKGNTLSGRFGEKGFDYAGNSSVDIPVWQQAREAIVVNANDHLAQRAGKIAAVGQVFNEPGSLLRTLVKALRPHQWVKNIIIFVPVLTSHNLGNP
ncbi:MAG TPA: haloacid dehalogenase-like hydrolase, partial [Verrucomicrobiae bacterium]|nr:haloacid dehalogenase-like hydrolase [Verrucomicrobiae bacterium]